MPLRLVMMATGRFALPTFQALLSGPHEVCGLITQPDRTGRGHHRHPHPMKEAALARGTPVFQPADVNAAESLAVVRDWRPDVCVVAAYGQILSAEFLAIPRWGGINLHASLLPKYRGAAPVPYAVLNDEAETGVTIFQMEPRLDAGPILGVARTPIGPAETAGELELRLAELAIPLTLRVLEQIAAGTTQPIPQDASRASRAPRLKKSAGAIDWTQPARRIDCHVRAMQPWPMAYTALETAAGGTLRLIVLEVQPSQIRSEAPPGCVVHVDAESLHVQTGCGAVRLVRLRPEGKRDMSAREFLCGHPIAVGMRFR